jgi:hypothetical protein
MQKLLPTRDKNWIAFETKYLNLLKPKVLRSLGTPRHPTRSKIAEFVRTNIDTILIGQPVELQHLIKRFNSKRAGGISFKRYVATNRDFKARLQKVFAYKWFRKKHGPWLGQAIGIKACPYCNSQFVLTLDKDEKALFNFDHFFPKSIYPYLAISLYNLIPSCYYCNLRKKDSIFNLNELIHPYLESFQSISSFSTDPGSIIKFLTGSESNVNVIKINLKLQKNGKMANENGKFMKQNQLFLIEGIYDNHKDVAGDIYLKAKTYNKSLRQELLRLGKQSGINFLTNDDVDRMILGNYTTELDINKKPLSKFTIDIAREAKLIR